MADQKLRIFSAALRMTSEANESALASRKVSKGTVAEIVERSLSLTTDLPFSMREHAALRDVSDFIALSQRGHSLSRIARNTDLLPIGHPLCTRPHRMNEASLRESRARWMADDADIRTGEARALVAALHSAPFGSIEREYYEARVQGLVRGTIPLRALVAALGGNSSAARSARAKLQRRDSKGRFAWMGGGMSINIRMPDGSIRRMTGRTVAQGGKDRNGSTDTFDVEMPDGKIARLPAKGSEGSKAAIESESSPDGFSPVEADIAADEFILDFNDIEYVDAPEGFYKVEDYDGPGEAKYTDEAFSVVKYDKDDSDAPDPTFGELDLEKPIYAVTPWDDEGKDPYVFQSWADVQDYIRRAEVNRDKKEGRESPVLARLDDDQLDKVIEKIGDGDSDPEEAARELFGDLFGLAPAPSAPKTEMEAPEGAYLFDTSEKYRPQGRDPEYQASTDYTDDPVELAGRDYTNDDLIEALKEAVLPTEDGRPASGFGGLEFEKGREDVPAEALFEAIGKRKLDANDILSRIYRGEGTAAPEPEEAPEAPEPVAEMPEAKKALPPLLEGLSDEEKAKFEETGDYKPFLPKNESVDVPEGYTELSPEPFTPGEGDPAEFDPMRLSERDSDELFDSLRTAIEPGSGGMGPILTEDADGETARVDVPGEAIRDGLQLRGEATGDFIKSVYGEGFTPVVTESEAKKFISEIAKDDPAVTEEAPSEPSREARIDAIDTEISDMEQMALDGQNPPRRDGRIGWKPASEAEKVKNREYAKKRLEELRKEKAALMGEAEAPAEKSEVGPVVKTAVSRTGKYYSVKPSGEKDRSKQYTDEYGEFLFSTPVEDMTLNELSDFENIIKQTPAKARETLADLEREVKDEIARRSEGAEEPETRFDGDRFVGRDDSNKVSAIAAAKGVDSRVLLDYLKRRYGGIKTRASRLTPEMMEQFEKDHEGLTGDKLADAMSAWGVEREDVAPEPEAPVALPKPTPERPEGVYMAKASQLKPGDIAFKDDPDREYFVVESVEKKGSKTEVTGYYPGHQSQKKTWNSDTPITFIRGAKDLPPSGDGPALERPFAKNYGDVENDPELGWVPKDEAARATYLADKAEFDRAKAESGASYTPPIDVDAIEPIPLSAPSAPDTPAFTGDRIKELIAEAGGDPKKFAELLKKETVYYFDFETTGGDWDNPTPIQVAVYKYTNGELDGEPFIRFMNPGKPLSDWYEEQRAKDPSKLLKDSDGNPITNEWLATQADKDEVLAELFAYMGENPIIVAHKMSFDGMILDQQAERLGIPFTTGGRIDTLTLARKVFPKQRNDLATLAGRFGIEGKDWHDASADAEVLPEVLFPMLDSMKPWVGKEVLDVEATDAKYDSAKRKYDSDMDAYRRFAAERAAAEAWAAAEAGEKPELDKVVEDATVKVDAPTAEDAGPTTEGEPGMGKPVESVAGDKITEAWVLDDENTEDLGTILSESIEAGDFFTGKAGMSEVIEVAPDEARPHLMTLVLKRMRDGYTATLSFRKDKAYGSVRRRHSATTKDAPEAAPEVAETPAAPERSPFEEISTEGWEPFNPTDENGIRISKGSTPGVFLKDPVTGTEYYVKKPRSEEHARNEVLASALYEKAGIPSGRAYLGRNPDGELVIVSPLITGGKKDFDKARRDEAILDSAREGFAVDAWLNNWDVVGAGFDNMLTKDGVVYRIDAGGSLLFRARGGDKRAALTPEVTAIDSMRDSTRNPSSAAVFKGMTDDEIAESVKKLAGISDADIDSFTEAAFPDNEKDRDFISSRLKERRSYLLERFGVMEAEETPAVEETAAPEAEAPSAPTPSATTDTALDATDESGDVEKALEKALADPDLADERAEIEALLSKIKKAKKKTAAPKKSEEEKAAEDASAEKADEATDAEVDAEVAPTEEEVSAREAAEAEATAEEEETGEKPETPDEILRKLFEEFSPTNNGDGTYTVWEGVDAKDGKTIEVAVQKNKDNTFSVVWLVRNEKGEVERIVDAYRSRHSFKALKNSINRQMARAVGRYEDGDYKKMLDAMARRDKSGKTVGSTPTESMKMTHPSADGVTEVNKGDRVYNWKTGEWGYIVKRVSTHRGEAKTAEGEEYKYTDYVLFKADGKKARRTPSSLMFVADAEGKVPDLGIPVPEVGPKKKRFRPERPKTPDPVAPMPGDIELPGDDLPKASEAPGFSPKVRKEIDGIIAGRAESYRAPEPLDATSMSRSELISAMRERVVEAKAAGRPMGIDIPLGWKDYDLAQVIEENAAELGLDSRDKKIWLDALKDKVRGRKTSASQIKSTSPAQAATLVEAVEYARTNGRVAIATPLEAALSILKGGRWKTQFESRTSRGSYAPDYRATHETTSLDLHPGVDPKYRPVYGHLRIEEDRLSSRFGASGYGDIVWEMKPEIKDRATMTLSDSLGDPTMHLPLTGEVTEAQVVGMGRRAGALTDASRTPRQRVEAVINSPYLEVQIMGGVTLDDVQRVYMARPRTPDRKKFYQELINAGISVEFFDA